MNNLKYAKIFLGVGIIIGLSIPVSVIYNQTLQSAKRKKNIIVDQERMRKKIEENPSLRYHTELKTLPISKSSFNALVDNSGQNK